LKKVISILFLAIYLLTTTQLCELLKLPLLVEHYREHKQQNKDLTILGFLEIHYAHGSPKDADYDKDMKLPFKSLTNTNFLSVSFCTPFLVLKQQPVVLFYKIENHFSSYSFTYTSAYLSAIWQPPKYC